MKLFSGRSGSILNSLFRNVIGFVLTLFGFRIGLVNTTALGHLAFDTEVNYLESLRDKKRKKDIWFLLGDTANSTLADFWKMKLNATSEPWRLKIYSAIQPLPKYRSLILNRELGAGDGSILDRSGATFQLNQTQNVQARRLFKESGIDVSKPLILFCLRDNAYYRSKNDTTNLRVHSHRNVNAKEYTDSMNFFLAQGFSVVRMGRQVETAMEIEHESFVDLPFAQGLDIQSLGTKNRELLELALFQKCEFVISTGLGMDALATMFRKRVFLSDYYSIYNLYASKLYPLFLPKGYVRMEDKRTLTPTEVLNSSFLKAQTASEFEKHNIELQNCKNSQLLKFMADILRLETRKEESTPSRLATEHSAYLSKNSFRDKKVPRISEHWQNNYEGNAKGSISHF